MQSEQFWELIDQSRQGIEGCDEASCNEQVANLVKLLEALTPEEIIGFDQHIAEHRIEAYRWDLWGAAYIVNGGCSDDGFEYFRCWLIGQGCDFYNAVLSSPERVAERVSVDEEADCEEIMYAADYAYKRKTGQDLPPTRMNYPAEPQGERWSDEDLERLYPTLCQRYWGEGDKA
jgi:hypothetical protein